MRKLLNLNTVYIAAVIIVLGAILVPLATEWVNLRNEGISHVAKDVEGVLNNVHPIEGEYTVEIDLSDLEKNEGKLLFDDGENRIYVSKVIVLNESDYEVIFRSSGTYSSGGATLVSGIDHVYFNNSFTNDFKAEAQATFRGDTYKLTPSRYSGLDYLDGDEFGFYLLPTGVEIDAASEETMIEVTVNKLQLNLWAKK